MTRTLILTRHAKSSWDNPFQDDHARPLNKRGRKSAKAVGAWLAERGWRPDEVLSSSAQRTQETWERMDLSSGSVTFTRELFHASPSGMYHALTEARGETVLMLGHNPGIAGFASDLVRADPPHPRFFDYPTCATAVIRFPIDDWRELDRHSGEVLDFVIPRELLE